MPPRHAASRQSPSSGKFAGIGERLRPGIPLAWGAAPRFGTIRPLHPAGNRTLADPHAVNFLAHALLSPDDAEVLAGNVFADLIKGRVEGIAPPGIVTGIALHRAIDRFADRHHAFRSCLACVAAPRRRYARVIVDVFFDHCLARRWADYSTVDLDAFVEHVCTRVERQAEFLPVRDRQRLERMLESRWLALYATRVGLDRAFAGLARRARYGHRLGEAAADLDRHYPTIDAAFRVLMPALREHVDQVLARGVD